MGMGEHNDLELRKQPYSERRHVFLETIKA